MKKADVEVGRLYRYRDHEGGRGLAMVLSLDDRYEQKRGRTPDVGYPALIAWAGRSYPAYPAPIEAGLTGLGTGKPDPPLFEGASLERFEVGAGDEEPLPCGLQREVLKSFASLEPCEVDDARRDYAKSIQKDLTRLADGFAKGAIPRLQRESVCGSGGSLRA